MMGLLHHLCRSMQAGDETSPAQVVPAAGGWAYWAMLVVLSLLSATFQLRVSKRVLYHEARTFSGYCCLSSSPSAVLVQLQHFWCTAAAALTHYTTALQMCSRQPRAMSCWPFVHFSSHIFGGSLSGHSLQ